MATSAYVCQISVEHSAAQQQHAFISIVCRCRTTRRIKINICFCIEEKMRGWRETHPAKYESRDGRALSRVGAFHPRPHTSTSATLTRKRENMKSENLQRKMLARVLPNSCLLVEWPGTQRAACSHRRRARPKTENRACARENN